MQVLWGAFSPQVLQKSMDLFEKDLESMAAGTLDVAAISKLASLGTNGPHAEHIWRDLQKWLPKPKLPSLHYMFLPLYNSVLGRFSKLVPMILPHKLFPAIFHHYPIMFDKLVYGSRDHCRRFWKSVSNSEHFRSHS